MTLDDWTMVINAGTVLCSIAAVWYSVRARRYVRKAEELLNRRQ